MTRRPARRATGGAAPGRHARVRTVLPLLTALWLALQPWAAAAEALRYGGDRDFRPFEFVDDSGKPQGFQIDLLEEIARVGPFEVSIRLDDWQSIERDFRAGRLDVVAMSSTRARRNWADLLRPHATPAMGLYFRAGAPPPVSLANLAEHTVAVPESEPMRQSRADFFAGEQYRFATYPTPLAALEAVRDGRADYALMPRAYGDAALGAGTLAGIVASEFSPRLQDYGFAVAPGNVALRQALEAALDRLERSGKLEALRVKWLSSHRDAAQRTVLQKRIDWLRADMVAIAVGAAAALGWLAVILRRRALQAIHERRRRREAESALRLAEERLARAFTRHPDAMLITEHASGVVLDANPALCRLVGVPLEALLGQSVDALPAFVDPATVSLLRGMLDQDGAIESASLQVRRSDGEIRACLVSAEAFASGASHHVFSIIRDVTDQLRASEELRRGYDALAESAREQASALKRAQANLARTDQEMQALTASISHDLRAPLRAIRGFSGLLKEDLQAGHVEEALGHAMRIDRAAHRMDEMIEALTRLARASDLPLEIGAVDMTAQAREAWALVTAAEAANEAALRIADLPPAIGDARLLAQVWQNLLANALKYSARSAQPKVAVDAFNENGHQWYRVTDNGVGFAMDHAKHLFEPFRRLHSAAEFPGTGIGLSIVRRIVRRHGGEIRARASVGVGAVFEFTLQGKGEPASAEAPI